MLLWHLTHLSLYNPESLWHRILFLSSNSNVTPVLKNYWQHCLGLLLCISFTPGKRNYGLCFNFPVFAAHPSKFTLSRSPWYVLRCASREQLLQMHSGEPATVVLVYLEMGARLPMWPITRQSYLQQLGSLPTPGSQRSWQQEIYTGWWFGTYVPNAFSGTNWSRRDSK